MAECPGIWRLAETKDGGLARLRLPGGSITAAQLYGVATIARSAGNGIIDLTHRANLQIRGLDFLARDAVAAALEMHGLMAEVPDADRLRNILASPLAGLDPSEIIDVTDTVRALDQALQACSAVHSLSPKFSYVLDGGGSHDLSGFAHDIALLAEHGSQGPLFRISLAGHFTHYAVEPSQAAEAAVALAAVAATADGHAPRRVSALLESFSTDDVIEQAENPDAPMFKRIAAAQRPIAQTAPCVGAIPQREPGQYAFGLGVPLARLTHESAVALSALSQRYGDGTLRLTPWQSIVLPAVRAQALDELVKNAGREGFLTTPEQGAMRVLACAGSTGCDRARVDTKHDGLQLLEALDAVTHSQTEPLTIHLCGCNRGCAHPGHADILLLGGTQEDSYQVYRETSPGEAADMTPYASQINSADVSALVTRFLRDGS